MLAGGDEWPLTDWFENALIAAAPDLYDDLANGCEASWDHDDVRQVLNDMATAWTIPGVFGPGGPEAVLDTDREELVRQVGTGEVALAFGPSFLGEAFEELDESDQPAPFGFPTVNGERPLLVGATIAIVPRQPDSSSDQGQRLVRWLTGDRAVEKWAQEDSGFLTPNELSPHRDATETDDDLRALLTSRLRPEPRTQLHFDMSDQLGVAGGGSSRPVWEIFVDFFEQVTSDPATRGAAINGVIQGLERIAQDHPGPEDRCEQ
jgi:hypothetical protein